eukprot:9483326-Pyramimonas_sp.AAC.1
MHVAVLLPRVFGRAGGSSAGAGTSSMKSSGTAAGATAPGASSPAAGVGAAGGACPRLSGFCNGKANLFLPGASRWPRLFSP